MSVDRRAYAAELRDCAVWLRSRGWDYAAIAALLHRSKSWARHTCNEVGVQPDPDCRGWPYGIDDMMEVRR